MTRRIGRVTVDDRGIRQRPILLLFGEKFDLTWDQITGWDSVEQVGVSMSSQDDRVMSRILELQTATKLHHVARSVSATDYSALVEEVRRRIPDKHRPSILRLIRSGSATDYGALAEEINRRATDNHKPNAASKD
jgi:hypothetical protein